MFSCKFCEIFKNTYFVEHLQTAASEFINMKKYVNGCQCCNQRKMVNFIGFYRLSFRNFRNIAASTRIILLLIMRNRVPMSKRSQ